MEKKIQSVYNDVCQGIFLAVDVQKFYFQIFLHTINVSYMKLCMMVVLIDLYPFILLSIILIMF